MSDWFPNPDELPEQHKWSGRPTAETLQGLPNSPAVYLLIDEHERPVQLLSTQQLRRVLISRLTDEQREARGQADLAAVVRGVRYRVVSGAFEARWWYWRLMRQMAPHEYRKQVSFGPAWFLHVDFGSRVPELRVTERVWRDTGEFLGPFDTRAATQRVLEGMWDLFDLCRYPEQVRRSPRGTRCAYAEMGRCDAPCDGSVPLEPYIERCRAAWAFALGGARQWCEWAEGEMQAAAAGLEFERAGLLKGQLEFARRYIDQWAGRIRPADQFNYLLLVPVTRRKAWKAFLFVAGDLAEGPVVPDRKVSHDVPAWLEGVLAGAGDRVARCGVVERMEQTWLVAQLLSTRAGEAAITVALPEKAAPADLGTRLSDLIAERRAVSASQTQDDAVLQEAPDESGAEEGA